MASKEHKKSEALGKYLKHSQAGLQFFVAIGLFTGLGYWIDTKSELLPLFTILGLAIGSVAGFWSLYRALFLRDQEDDTDLDSSDLDSSGLDSSGPDSSRRTPGN